MGFQLPSSTGERSQVLGSPNFKPQFSTSYWEFVARWWLVEIATLGCIWYVIYVTSNRFTHWKSYRFFPFLPKMTNAWGKTPQWRFTWICPFLQHGWDVWLLVQHGIYISHLVLFRPSNVQKPLARTPKHSKTVVPLARWGHGWEARDEAPLWQPKDKNWAVLVVQSCKPTKNVWESSILAI